MIAAPVALDGRTDARTARLLSSLLLIMIAFFAAIDLICTVLVPGYQLLWQGYILFGGAYALARTRFIRLSVNTLGTMLALLCIRHREKLEWDRQAELRASEDRYRILSNLVSDYALAYRIYPDGNGELEWITDAFTRISGYTLEEMRTSASWAKLVYPDDRLIAAQHVRRILNNQSDICEYRVIARDSYPFNAFGSACRRRHRAVRHPPDQRYRNRDGCCNARTHLRAVFHNEAERKRHRPGPADSTRYYHA